MARFGSKRIMGAEKWIFFLITVLVAGFGFGYDFRLPNDVIPEHYNIKILTDLSDTFHYNGEVCIEFTAKNAVNKIVLHSKNLKIFENQTKLEDYGKHTLPQFEKLTKIPKQLNGDDPEINAFKGNSGGVKIPDIVFDRYEAFEKEVIPHEQSNENLEQKIVNPEENQKNKPSETNANKKYPEVTSPAGHTGKENKATTAKSDYEEVGQSSTIKGSKYSEKSTTSATTPDDKIYFETSKPESYSENLTTSKYGSTGGYSVGSKRPETYTTSPVHTGVGSSTQDVSYTKHSVNGVSHSSTHSPSHSTTYFPKDGATHSTSYSSTQKVTQSPIHSTAHFSTYKVTRPPLQFATNFSTYKVTHSTTPSFSYKVTDTTKQPPSTHSSTQKVNYSPTHQTGTHSPTKSPVSEETYSPPHKVTHPSTYTPIHTATHSPPEEATHPQNHGQSQFSTQASVNHETYAIVEIGSSTHATVIPPAIGFIHPMKDTQSDVPEGFNVLKHEFDQEYNFLKVHLDRPLTPGKKYRLYLKYTGVLSNALTGFYRVPYTKRGSQKSTWLASTVFEPNEARTAFPCFDEPALKATFDVTLGHEKKFTALSNMPLKSKSSVEGKPDWQWSEFETTPRMSTYLVAFVISDLEYLSPRINYTESGQNVTYRFWSRHDVLYKTRYAMRIAPEMKNYLEKLFEVRDVLPKHDFVALPSFISSALENWGLYSFAEKNLLFTPGFSSLFSKYEITHVLGHEIAHIWFGNMVTPKWWDQIWLSEGFSNFFEIVAADHIQPAWDLKTISVIYSYLKVFTLDALHTSHPLVPKLSHPNDLNEIFDSISYQKGFYLVRMLNYTLGQETFMNGVRKYLNTYHLSNADEDDLWEVLTECAHQENTLPGDLHLKELMYSWTRRTGYPIIDVYRDYENHTANVTQRRFLRSKDDYEFRDNSGDFEGETKWWIPLTYTTGSELNFRDFRPRTWLSPKEDYKILTDMPSRNDFVLMNLDAAGLYRVNYDERNWALIISYLINENSSDISVINRVQILDDLLDLARTGEISYATAFDATSYLAREKHFLPWKAALSNFDFISRMLRSTDSSKSFKKFMRSLVAPRFEELGFEAARNENLSDGFNRKQIAKWACKTGLRQCTRKSISLFKKWTEERKPDEHNPIPSSLRSTVYCTAIEKGGSKDWQFLWQRYLSNVVTDKSAVLYGLGCSKSTRTLRKYLDWSIRESSGIKKQDIPIVFKSVARNDIGFNLAKTFLKERLGDIKAYLGNNPYYLPQMLEAVASKMNQPSDLEELEELEQAHFSHQRSVPRSFRQATERVRFNINWVEKNYKPITAWLKRQKY